jgi:hypothetical protein
MSYKSNESTFHENTFKQFVISTCLSSLWYVLIISLLRRLKQVVYSLCSYMFRSLKTNKK